MGASRVVKSKPPFAKKRPHLPKGWGVSERIRTFGLWFRNGSALSGTSMQGRLKPYIWCFQYNRIVPENASDMIGVGVKIGGEFLTWLILVSSILILFRRK